jgi:L-iditol 2-dehydrogenase
MSGADPVIVIGAPASRLAHARELGATHTFDLDVPAEDRLAEVRALTNGRGVDVVIEAAGAPRAVTDALDLVRDGGRVIVAGQYTDYGDIPINPHRHINRKHVEIRGCWGSDYSHFHRAVQFLSSHGARLPWTAAISRRYSLEEANEALAAVEARSVVKAIIEP